ncbi:hypothetical protein Z950_523 [Sulfitobacter mediterraneus KCTC 32188]|nr:hypothetical protein Z950_523 [Sulfitobacter mediterraneus KCTC 32188]
MIGPEAIRRRASLLSASQSARNRAARSRVGCAKSRRKLVRIYG